jgi:hypothetical protein
MPPAPKLQRKYTKFVPKDNKKKKPSLEAEGSSLSCSSQSSSSRSSISRRRRSRQRPSPRSKGQSSGPPPQQTTGNNTRGDFGSSSGTKKPRGPIGAIGTAIKNIEDPAKKLGKLALWSAPLILAGLEIRHEIHEHAHKRKMMDLEKQKAHLELQLEMGKHKASADLKIEKENGDGEPKPVVRPILTKSTTEIPTRRVRIEEPQVMLPLRRRSSVEIIERRRSPVRRYIVREDGPRMFEETRPIRTQRVRRVPDSRPRVRFPQRETETIRIRF